jgi:hypothetical protein
MAPPRSRVRFPVGANFRSGLKKISRYASPILRLRLMFATLRHGIVAEWVVVAGPLVMGGQGSGIFSACAEWVVVAGPLVMGGQGSGIFSACVSRSSS